MNANEKFIAANAQVDEAAIHPLPNSRKIYVTGSQPDIRVPMREISQSDTPASMGVEKNPPVFVYDCSGVYSDPAVKIDIRAGLPALRQSWIEARGDTEMLAGLSSEYGRAQAADPALAHLRFPGLQRTPRRAKAGTNVSQMHYARKGIITPEMEYIAIRENLHRRAYIESRKPPARPASAWLICSVASTVARILAPPYPRRSPRNSCAAKWPVAAPSSPPTSTTPNRSR